MSRDWKVTSLVICDDIRSESTNKDVLIGVYAGDIAVSKFPAEFKIAIWAEIVPQKSGKNALGLLVKGNNSSSEVTFLIDSIENQPETIITTNRVVSMREAGELNIFMRDKDDWTLIKSKKVIAA
jgi:hypothetical protein